MSDGESSTLMVCLSSNRIAMVTASFMDLGRTAGFTEPNSKAHLYIRAPQLEMSHHKKEKKLLLPPHKMPKGTGRQETQHHIRALRKASTITLIKRFREISSHHQSRQAVAIQCTSSLRAKSDYSFRSANSLKQFPLLLILSQPEVVRL